MNLLNLSSNFFTDNAGNTIVRVSYVDARGNSILKNISYENYLALLKGATTFNKTSEFIHTGRCNDELIDSYVGTNGEYAIVFDVKAHRNYFGLGKVGSDKSHSFVIPFPRLLFLLQLKVTKEQTSVVSGNCFALAGTEELTPDTMVYQYPFGNVSSNGHICFGSSAKDMTIKSIIDTRQVIDFFFLSNTVGHYYSPAAYSTLNVPQEELIKKLCNMPEFDDKFLVPNATYANYGEVYNDVFKTILKGGF